MTRQNVTVPQKWAGKSEELRGKEIIKGVEGGCAREVAFSLSFRVCLTS